MHRKLTTWRPAVVVISLVCAVANLAPVADAATGWVAGSPDRRISATVRCAGGRLTLSAVITGRPVITADLGPAAISGRVGVIRRQASDRYLTPTGKRRRHDLTATRMIISLSPQRRLEVLVADDGVAVRLLGAGRRQLAWRAGRAAGSWLQRHDDSDEQPFQPGALARQRAGRYDYPALLRTEAGDWVLLTESGVPYGQGATSLAKTASRPAELRVSGLSTAASAAWQVAVIGSLADIVASDLPTSLGRPSQLADTSWIRPGRVAFPWWSEGTPSGKDLAVQERYVDAAAREGFEYVEICGHDPAWMPDLSAYASARGVRIILWAQYQVTPYSLQFPAIGAPAARRAFLDQAAAWGVAGVKLDFLLGADATRLTWMEDAAREAADRRLVVNFHGLPVPHGLQRTWPNVVTAEAVRGAEYARNGEPVSPAHDVNLVFTRNVVGSMDYTPAIVSARNQQTTLAHRLAQTVAYESGLVTYADNAASYDAQPLVADLLRSLPTAWDDTRLLAGAPDRSATIARRAGRDWFIGGLSATAARVETVALGFLVPGRRYDARVITDDGAGGLTVSRRQVTRSDALTVPVAADGGFTVRLSTASPCSGDARRGPR